MDAQSVGHGSLGAPGLVDCCSLDLSHPRFESDGQFNVVQMGGRSLNLPYKLRSAALSLFHYPHHPLIKKHTMAVENKVYVGFVIPP